jgi:hypothetical protein
LLLHRDDDDDDDDDDDLNFKYLVFNAGILLLQLQSHAYAPPDNATPSAAPIAAGNGSTRIRDTSRRAASMFVNCVLFSSNYYLH